jgi:hypothetical protein
MSDCGCYIKEIQHQGGQYGEELWSTFELDDSKCKYHELQSRFENLKEYYEESETK